MEEAGHVIILLRRDDKSTCIEFVHHCYQLTLGNNFIALSFQWNWALPKNIGVLLECVNGSQIDFIKYQGDHLRERN